jgi:glutamate dehydrogenase (NAD(P)+)
MLHEHNADLLDCKVLLEGANSPTTPKADRILRDKGIYIAHARGATSLKP